MASRLLTPLAAVTLHGVVAIQCGVNAGFGANFSLATGFIVAADTGEAGEDARLHVASTSVATFAILLRITSFIVGQLIDAATRHSAAAGQLVVTFVNTLRVIGHSAIFCLACVLLGYTSIRVIALDAAAQYTGEGAIVATIEIFAKYTIGICRAGGTILGSPIRIATTRHCLIIRSGCVALLILCPVDGAWQELSGCNRVAVSSTTLITLSAIGWEDAHIAVILAAGFALGIICIGARRIGAAATHCSIAVHFIPTHLCRRRAQLIKARPVCRSCGALCLRAVAVAAHQELVAQLARATEASWLHATCSVLKAATCHDAICV